MISVSHLPYFFIVMSLWCHTHRSKEHVVSDNVHLGSRCLRQRTPHTTLSCTPHERMTWWASHVTSQAPFNDTWMTSLKGEEPEAVYRWSLNWQTERISSIMCPYEKKLWDQSCQHIIGATRQSQTAGVTEFWHLKPLINSDSFPLQRLYINNWFTDST